MGARAAAFARLLAVAAPLLASPTVSAAPDCILDNCADRRPATPQRSFDRDDRGGRDVRRNGYGPRGASIPGQFDFYVLALSWSPGFCEMGGGDEKGREQCRRGSGTGFTVHGLWPQYERGFPSDCSGASRFPSRDALRATDGVYPDPGLARYEWRKHGTCSGLSPNDYFAAARLARAAITVPPQFKDPHQVQTMAPLDVERAFTNANARLRPGMIAAICRGGTLEEVRFCFTKDLKTFQLCPEVVRSRCRSQAMTIPPVR